DPEVIRIRSQPVDPVDVRSPDGAVDVDLARMAGDRLDERRVEVAAGLCREQLEDAVDRVECDAGAEPAEQPPVDALARMSEVVDRGDEEREMEDELAEPLAELRQSLRRLEVVEADQVDEQEEPEEGDHEAGR